MLTAFRNSTLVRWLLWDDAAQSPERNFAPLDEGENAVAAKRLHLLMRLFVVACTLIVAKAVYFELTSGPGFREAATHPRKRFHAAAALRGQILTKDGTVLAEDFTTQALAVHYRYLEEPLNAEWLRAQARSRLTKAERRAPDKLSAEEHRLAESIFQLRHRVAKLCHLTSPAWEAECAEIQNRVSALSAHVNELRQRAFVDEETERSSRTGFWSWLSDWLTLDDPIPPPQIVIAEELDYHMIADDITPDIIAEVLQNPADYPGVKIISRQRRVYPEHALGGNLVGYLGEPQSGLEDSVGRQAARTNELVGKQGIESQRQNELCGVPGRRWEQFDRLGGITDQGVELEPIAGKNVTLTLDAELQKSSERILDEARARAQQPASSGAILVMDMSTGAILAAASEPRFDPNVFASPSNVARQALLANTRHPLLERTSQMALPPGSIFKLVTGLAALVDGGVDEQETIDCQGYFAIPDRERCLLFRRQGMGHGPVDFATALAASCNVYFYKRAMQVGPSSLLQWAQQVGFGEKTGCDFATEAKGSVIQPHAESWSDTQTRAAAIGQSTLTVTPLQVARLVALIANGHALPVPHLTQSDIALTGKEVAIPPRVLAAIRAGMKSAVSDEVGTAHDALLGVPLVVAGKTGSAQGAKDSESHAWFAGYVPADAPRVVFVVALEQGGDGGTAAAPLARQLLLRMAQLKYFD